jgi:hypothetical protein
MKFKIGDRVQLNDVGIKVHSAFINQDDLYEIEGTVVRIYPRFKYPIYVKWGTHFKNVYCYEECELDFLDESIIDVDDLFEGIEV